VVEASAELGDRQLLRESIRIAGHLTANDPDARADVQALAARFADQLAVGGAE